MFSSLLAPSRERAAKKNADRYLSLLAKGVKSSLSEKEQTEFESIVSELGKAESEVAADESAARAILDYKHGQAWEKQISKEQSEHNFKIVEAREKIAAAQSALEAAEKKYGGMANSAGMQRIEELKQARNLIGNGKHAIAERPELAEALGVEL